MRKSSFDVPGPLGQTSVLSVRWRWYLSCARFFLNLKAWVIRIMDLCIAGCLLIVVSPVMIVLALLSLIFKGELFTSDTLVGRYGQPFQRHQFAFQWGGMGHSALLLNIINGSMAFVGPRAMTPEEARSGVERSMNRLSLRPGLISSFGLRRRVGMAYENEATLDDDFFYDESLTGNAGILARAAIGRAITGGEKRQTPDHFVLLGCPIVNTTMADAIEWIVRQLDGTTTHMAAFVNPDCLNIASRNRPYLDALRQADIVWPDGIGINVGLRMLGLALKDNVNGTDLFPRLCERLASEGRSIYLLGARPGIAALAARNMAERYPGLRIAGTRDGYFTPEEEGTVIDLINRSAADVLLTAFGAPKQELWLQQHREKLKPRVLIGVGGLFDFYSGRIARAPTWMREIGMEWSWRILQEPGRMWRRYLIGNPLFLARVYRQKLQEQAS